MWKKLKEAKVDVNVDKVMNVLYGVTAVSLVAFGVGMIAKKRGAF